MNVAPAIAGWAAAALAVVVTLLTRRVLARRMESVARACHELRGPLTTARLGIALGSRGPQLSAQHLRAIDTELGRASRVLEDLTRVGRGMQMRGRGDRPGGRWDLVRVDVLVLLSDALEAADGLAQRSGVALSGCWDGPGAIVWGDRLRLAQALGNLLGNAIEHGGGHVQVRGTVRGDAVRIEVDDDGPGLPGPVARLAARPRAGRGARGRGLAIALAIADAHGGTVTAAPVGRGGRVVLVLPLAAS